MTLKLDKLFSSEALTDAMARPSRRFQQIWQNTMSAIETSFNDIATLVDGLVQAQNDITDLGNNKQDADATLTALAGLDATAGVIEQTGADTFAKRGIGVASATDLLTRANGDARYMMSGAVTFGTRLVSASVSVDADDYFIAVDATATGRTITLPALTDGRALIVKKVDATGHTVTVSPAGGDTIEGSGGYTLSGVGDVVRLIGDAVEWRVI